MMLEGLTGITKSSYTGDDLISRADAIEALGEEPEIWNDTEEEWAYRNAWVEHISALKALPSAEAPTENTNTPTDTPTDLIRRADAIDAVIAEGRNVYTSEYANAERIIYEADAVEVLAMLPSEEPLSKTRGDCQMVWIPKEPKCKPKPPKTRKINISTDLISRQDAINAVTRAIWHYPNECYKNLNVYEVAEALAGDAIKSLPSAEPKTGWIPVSERLPNVGEDVLFCVADMYVSEGCRRDDGDWWQFRWSSVQPRSVVTAWMPLPEPYKGGEE